MQLTDGNVPRASSFNSAKRSTKMANTAPSTIAIMATITACGTGNADTLNLSAASRGCKRIHTQLMETFFTFTW